MFTRCPQCNTMHPLTAALLSHTRGLVQCGECGRTFSSLSFLFDEWPGGKEHGPAKGPDAIPPKLEKSRAKAATDDSRSAEDDLPDEKVIKPNRLAWVLATSLLVVLTFANAAKTFLDPIEISRNIDSWQNQTETEKEGLYKDPAQIQLVSRDMHTHPTRSGILVLSLTFVNLAQQNQQFPELEITLLDATNQAVARRRFQPLDYLRPVADTEPGLATDVYLPVLLELVDPGDQAVGFEIHFF